MKGGKIMLKQNWRKTVSIALLGALVVTATPMPSMAQTWENEKNRQENNTIQPRLAYIVSTMNGFGIDNGVAEIDCWVTGDVLDATKTKVIAELQVKNGNSWIPVKIWTDTQNDYRASVYEHYTVNPNNTYRVKATFYVWEGSQSESLIVISNEKP